MNTPNEKKEPKKMNFPKQTWSLTIGNGGENHTGMEFLGKKKKERRRLGSSSSFFWEKKEREEKVGI